MGKTAASGPVHRACVERTLRICAPDPARGQPPVRARPVGEDATAATDVYALGSTLYRLLSGRLPFPPAANPIATLFQRVHQPPTDLRHVASHVPDGLAEVVMRSLATEPVVRPDAAAAQGGPGTDTRPAVVAEVERWRRRAEHPMSSRAVVTVAQDLVRVCERLLHPPAPPV